MALTILDEQLKIGQVKYTTSNLGKYIDYVELLFSPTTKAEFKPSDDKTSIIFSVSDNHFDLPEMVCELNYDTVRNLIVSLTNIYKQLELKDDVSDDKNDKTETKPENTKTSGCCRKRLL